jgi:hypothetical protein
MAFKPHLNASQSISYLPSKKASQNSLNLYHLKLRSPKRGRRKILRLYKNTICPGF